MKPARFSQLNFVEQDLVRGLNKKPFLAWCVGCARFIVRVHRRTDGIHD